MSSATRRHDAGGRPRGGAVGTASTSRTRSSAASSIGSMHVVRRASSPRFVINFPTKRHWRQPSKLEYIEAGLVDLVARVRELGIRSIAVPPLGCGLAWSDVKPL